MEMLFSTERLIYLIMIGFNASTNEIKYPQSYVEIDIERTLLSFSSDLCPGLRSLALELI